MSALVIIPHDLAGAGRGIIVLLLLGICIPIVLILLDYVRVLKLRQRLPPGPIPIPLFGNYFQVSKVRPWVEWERVSQSYGNPLITVWNGHRPVIICNDAWTMSELCEKRAARYSSRPRMYAMGDMTLGTTTNQVCLVYGDSWRLHRRLMHTVVGSQAVRGHQDIQANESKLLTLDLLQSPDCYELSIERYSVSVVSIIGWGRRIAQVDDVVARIALSLMEGVDLVIPCYHIVEVIPWLLKLPRWIYAAPAKMMALTTMGSKFWVDLSREAAVKATNDAFAKRLVKEQAEHGFSDMELGCLTGNLIGGGVDTTSGSNITFILAMCVFPEVQKRAQAEIDQRVGHNRSPTADDELPYVQALVSEVLRWRTVTILGGIPHAPICDDVYQGYHIPEGTAIVGNVWAIHRHPREFPDPDTFRPERFLNGLERPYPNKKGHNAFGWGRRQCSGAPLAEQGLYLTIARLLWAFHILPGLDQNGKEAKLDIFKYKNSENMRPEPFKARFIPRSAEIEYLIREEARSAEEKLTAYDTPTEVVLGMPEF